MLRFVEELLILIEEEQIPNRTLRYALAGAVLMDLALEHRIDTDLQALYLTDAMPLGDALLDPVLAEIAAGPESQSCEFWVRRIAEKGDCLHAQALARLEAQGIMESDDGGFFTLALRVNRSHRYPRNPSLAAAGEASEQEIRSRLMEILFNDDVIPSPRDIAIISLCRACGLFRRTMTPEEYNEVEERIELIARLEQSARALTEAIRTMTVAETQAERRLFRERRGSSGWPKASGWLPVIGHALKLTGDIRAFFTEQYLKHGPVFEVNAFGNSFVVMAGPEANLFMIREGKFHLRSREVWDGFKDWLGVATLLVGMDGADHRLLRRTKRRGYSRQHILERLREAVAVVERELTELPSDRPVPVVYTMQRVMTEQISLLSAGSSSRERIDDIITFNDAMLMVFIARRYPKFMTRTPKVMRARRRLELHIERMLNERELKLGDETNDLVDDLLELRHSAPDFLADTDMFIAAMGPFMVGLDTVAPTTSFALYALLKHPDVLERARAEADELFASGELTSESLARMTVTRGAILEALRMYPIGPALSRTVTNSFDFAGYRIPYGTDVLIAMTVTHYLPEFFPEPERFDVERYSPERRENVQPGAFVPFGLGHHSCLGQGFAEVQMILTIATLLHRAEIVLAPPGYRLKVQQTPTPRPAGNFKIRLRPRQ